MTAIILTANVGNQRLKRKPLLRQFNSCFFYICPPWHRFRFKGESRRGKPTEKDPAFICCDDIIILDYLDVTAENRDFCINTANVIRRHDRFGKSLCVLL